eukprot:3900602-Pleurochrysis_carterae.AAC.1
MRTALARAAASSCGRKITLFKRFTIAPPPSGLAYLMATAIPFALAGREWRPTRPDVESAGDGSGG